MAAMTYYFPSKEELFNETLRAAAAADVEELRAAAQLAATDPVSLADAIADLFLEQLSRRRDLLLAQFELSLQAARRPELRAPTASGRPPTACWSSRSCARSARAIPMATHDCSATPSTGCCSTSSPRPRSASRSTSCAPASGGCCRPSRRPADLRACQTRRARPDAASDTALDRHPHPRKCWRGCRTKPPGASSIVISANAAGKTGGEIALPAARIGASAHAMKPVTARCPAYLNLGLCQGLRRRVVVFDGVLVGSVDARAYLGPRRGGR